MVGGGRGGGHCQTVEESYVIKKVRYEVVKQNNSKGFLRLTVYVFCITSTIKPFSFLFFFFF